MSINNINVNTKIDGLMNQHVEDLAKSGKPQGPAPAPAGGAPEGMPTARNSGSSDMAPRMSLGQKHGLVPTSFGAGGPGGPGGSNGPDHGGKLDDMFKQMQQGGDKATNRAENTMDNQMQSLFKATELQMKFTMISSEIQSLKDMNTAVAKSIKGIGSGVKDMIN